MVLLERQFNEGLRGRFGVDFGSRNACGGVGNEKGYPLGSCETNRIQIGMKCADKRLMYCEICKSVTTFSIRFVFASGLDFVRGDYTFFGGAWMQPKGCGYRHDLNRPGVFYRGNGRRAACPTIMATGRARAGSVPGGRYFPFTCLVTRL
jgi:hypothetical protein